MARTVKASKTPGTEYWGSRLHPGGETPGRFTKQRTARLERREASADARAFRFAFDLARWATRDALGRASAHTSSPDSFSPYGERRSTGAGVDS